MQLLGILTFVLSGMFLNSAACMASEHTKDIYLAGGCFWGVEEYFSRIPGVVGSVSGYANGKTQNPTYKQVCSGNTGFAETVHVTYDPEKISLKKLIASYFKIIDPVSINRQGNDRGHQYRTGIFYVSKKDLEEIETVYELEKEKHPMGIAVELKPLENFYPAEDCHQDYIRKNPNGYCHIDFSQLDSATSKEPSIDQSQYSRPTVDQLLAMLTERQFAVTQKNATEAPYDSDLLDNHKKGLYVDVTTGEPLFSSEDKFDSGCGWPSFTKPLAENVVKTSIDKSHSMKRVEVRSRVGDAHLGHVFGDGPKDKGGLRYCINGASLRFVPYEDMEKEGYGALKSIFH